MKVGDRGSKRKNERRKENGRKKAEKEQKLVTGKKSLEKGTEPFDCLSFETCFLPQLGLLSPITYPLFLLSLPSPLLFSLFFYFYDCNLYLYLNLLGNFLYLIQSSILEKFNVLI